MRPPAPLKAKWILPRCFVCASRISHVFFFARIKSNQGFFTTSKSFVERRRALLLPASFFFRPAVVLPLLPGAPWAPLLPLLPGAPLLLPRLPGTPPPPRNAFRRAFASDAFVLKQVMQDFARGEAASFLQPGMLHGILVFVDKAAPGKLKTGTKTLSINSYGTTYIVCNLVCSRCTPCRAPPLFQ